MSRNKLQEAWVRLVEELCKLPNETEWVEFKHNKAEPQEIGEYISGLSNSGALNGKAHAYLIWGIEDKTHRVIGTSFDPLNIKVGNEELENWLLRMLTPKIHFSFITVDVQGKRCVILEVERAIRNPVQFNAQEYIRIGSYQKRLKDFPERERKLWRIFDSIPFESGVAIEDLSETDVLSLLDFTTYFDLLGRPLPRTNQSAIEFLQADKLLNASANGRWEITNLGALLFAKRLDAFGPLQRKAMRVIRYRGNNRIATIREQIENKGYGSGFEGLISYVDSLMPSNEIIRQALRSGESTFPELAVRELVANALIHQDLSITGAGPMVEIFDDRVEFTNPGKPLVSTERFVDLPPRSRNEALASFMRRIGVCEERGSGWDKVVWTTETHQLPAPLTEATDVSTKVVLFAHRPLNRMDRDDRIRALYQHACLRFVNRENMTNTSVRQRFGIETQNSATASRMIKEALDAGKIIAYDSSAAPRLMRYLPYWAEKTNLT